MLKLGDKVRIEKDGDSYVGILMPSSHKDFMIIKLENGYNIGLRSSNSKVMLVEKGQESSPTPLRQHIRKEKLPRVSILSTGGTIASRVDYRTGAVTSQFSAEEILSAIPELEDIANYNSRVIYQILSENMRAEYWIELARAVDEEIRNGSTGIIITHGTDTMMYTSAALSFMIRTPVPIVLVGSQRSSDRPSSDAAMNAICAATVATSDIAEVCVVMHGTTSDDYCSIHRGTRVRKMHTSRRDAFRSINSGTIGKVEYLSRQITTFADHMHRNDVSLELIDKLEPKCALVKYSPGASSDILNYFIDDKYKGIVIEGTGLGHVASDWIDPIRRATEDDIPVVVTSQCLRGRICDRVYDTGRDMLNAGAIEGEDMLPEVALVKLMWILANKPEDVRRLMRIPIAGEISPSTSMIV
ncbi:MAG: Glu-tRNA(Gln) amidotransferase subunit GatD [Methanotrichaceae archaeon]|nr:Glu-tRNA(Gln) amidotransferase subunit GatD [Methanotrichaceae archaeon]